MSNAKKKNTVLVRLDDKELRALDARRAHEQKKHPGRVVTRAGLARELIVIALDHPMTEPG
jgi:hypothetical protein